MLASFTLVIIFVSTNGMTFHHANDIISNTCSTCPTVEYLGYRTPTEVSSMSQSDCKNTLIVELSKLTSDSTNNLQQLSTDDLIGYNYASNALWYYNITTMSQLTSMSLNDQRNEIINKLALYYPYAMKNISETQGFNIIQLTNNLLSYCISNAEQNNNNYINDIQSILGDLVNINKSHIKFGVHDSMGNSMDAIHIIQSLTTKNLYYAAYHTLDTNTNQFNIHLSTSTDLINWKHIIQLLPNADMPFLYRVHVNGNDGILLLHEQWMNPNSAAPSRIGFKYFLSENDLLIGTYNYSYNASLTLGCNTKLEGTPSVWYAERNTNDNGINIYVGFHYNDDITGLDQNGFGILQNFGMNNDLLSWITYDENVYNKQLFEEYHIIGNIGQRALMIYNDINYIIQEGNIEPRPPTRWSDWRIWIWIDKQLIYQSKNIQSIKLEGDIYLLNIITPGGSYSLANPAISVIDCPNNSGFTNNCIFVSYFIFGEGAGPGESGSVIFFKQFQL
eukprot:502297_1